MGMTELSAEEIQLKILGHFAEFLGKLVGEEDEDACFSFAETMVNAITLKPISIDADGVITATMQLASIDGLLADFLSE